MDASRHPGRCTRAGMTGTRRCCSAPRATSRKQEFQRRRAVHLPAGGGRSRRGAGHAAGPAVLALSLRCDLRDAQLTRHEGGHFAIRPGVMMAGGAFFDIAVNGRGAHGARPEGGIDPVLAACHVVSAMQSIVSATSIRAIRRSERDRRSTAATRTTSSPPARPSAGPRARFGRETMDLIEASLRRVAENVAAGFGATASVDFRRLSRRSSITRPNRGDRRSRVGARRARARWIVTAARRWRRETRLHSLSGALVLYPDRQRRRRAGPQSALRVQRRRSCRSARHCSLRWSSGSCRKMPARSVHAARPNSSRFRRMACGPVGLTGRSGTSRLIAPASRHRGVGKVPEAGDPIGSRTARLRDPLRWPASSPWMGYAC